MVESTTAVGNVASDSSGPPKCQKSRQGGSRRLGSRVVSDGATTYPPDPRFETASEALVWSTLREQLRDGDVMLHGVRFSDPRAGDVEADILLLLPDLGAVVIEVKGGQVSYADGQWHTSYGGISRRIHPIDQARRAKHAVRRFLDRQPGWPYGYLRTEWMVAFPYTPVDGDLGPEGRRDLILGSEDLGSAMQRIVAVMSLPVSEPPVPAAPWVEQAIALLRVGDRRVEVSADEGRPESMPASPRSVDRRRWWAVGIAAAAVLAAGITGGVMWGRSMPARTGETVPVVEQAQNSGSCHPAYTPCVDPVSDVNCIDVGARVTVLNPAVDPLDLDRDGDGLGCESYPAT